MIRFERDDGGRAAAGYRGDAGDCAVRAFCILTGADYHAAYKEFAYANSVMRDERDSQRGVRSARNGVVKRAYEAVFRRHGIVKVKQGRGVKPTYTEAHERYGNCIVSTRGHLAAIVDGALRDTFDGRGYWWLDGVKLGDNFDVPPAGIARVNGENFKLRDIVEWRQRKAMSVWRKVY